jgi:hypothetical protein
MSAHILFETHFGYIHSLVILLLACEPSPSNKGIHTNNEGGRLQLSIVMLLVLCASECGAWCTHSALRDGLHKYHTQRGWAVTWLRDRRGTGGGQVDVEWVPVLPRQSDQRLRESC